MFNTFDLDKSFDILKPTLIGNPPLCRITQEGKSAILTTDFYLMNVEPRPCILPTPQQNNSTFPPKDAAAAEKNIPEIEPDPVQPRPIRPHSWMLYTSQTPVLDLH